MVAYKNKLVARQYKFVQQLVVFYLHRDLCDDLVFDLWKAVGELGALLWYPEITHMEEYLVSHGKSTVYLLAVQPILYADIEVLIVSTLDIWPPLMPTKLLTK
jgi:hypothetical protein